jgi:hypothetical protein
MNVSVHIRTSDGKFLVRKQEDHEAAKRYITQVRLHGLVEDELYVHASEIRQLEIVSY